jgi:VanZ family protein
MALVGLMVVSSIPDVPVNTKIETQALSFRLDYLLHFIAYTVIAFLFGKAYYPSLMGFVLLARFALLEEGHQLLIPGRTFNPVDLGFDLLGIGVVAIIWWLVKNSRK